MSSMKQGNPPTGILSPSSLSSGCPELTADGTYALTRLGQSAHPDKTASEADNIFTVSLSQGVTAIQPLLSNLPGPHGHYTNLHATSESDHGTYSTSDAKSISSGKQFKLGIGKRFTKFFKRDKVKNTVTPPSAPTLLNASLISAETTLLHEDIVPVALNSLSLAQFSSTPRGTSSSLQTATPSGTILAIQLHLSSSPLHQDILFKNMDRPTLTTPLPLPGTRIEQTTQLVYCCSVLSMWSTSASDTDETQDTPLDETLHDWARSVESMERGRFFWLLEQVVKTFSEDTPKSPDVVAEVVLLGPVLDRDTYRLLLSCFIAKLEQTILLDVSLLQGLVQLVECATSRTSYLVDNDLVRIATVISKELAGTHDGTSDHPLHLVLALSRVLDVMVAGKVKDLNRDRDHQPMLQLLRSLQDSDSSYLKYQAAYAYQALQYAPDDETPLQVFYRYAQGAAIAASAVTSVFKLDPLQLIDGLGRLQQIGSNAFEVIKAGIEGIKTFAEFGQGATAAAERAYHSQKKHSWYLAFQGTALFIRQGRLSDFSQVVCWAPCRHDVNFQWGICRQLGEIAVDPLWDTEVCRQAVDYLCELYGSSTDWKPHVDIKRWILTLLVQIASLENSSSKSHAHARLTDLLQSADTIAFSGNCPVRARLPLPVSFPLLTRVQAIPKVEYDLYKVRMQRIEEYNQTVYITPMAKPNLQAPEDNLYPLMGKVDDFLAGNGQVMLILGDSGAGKSTFNRHLEYGLWQDYKPGGRIPLFINLPALDRPDKELIAEQLRSYRFTETQVRELEQHRQFVLICDGYDESQLTCNLHTTNSLNQSGQRGAKLIITCRSQHLVPEYRDRFVPKARNQYHGGANDLFQEAVIAPFSKDQIEAYVEKYAMLVSRVWVKKDYMDKLTAIPRLMDLVRNPFLLTLALGALPRVVEGKTNLSRLRVTRVELCDSFVKHWLEVNRRRLQDQKLSESRRLALDDLLADGFERCGTHFQKDLAAAVFREQDGRPIVDYSNRQDRSSWKGAFFSSEPDVTLLRESSLLSRAGNQYRFIHRSVLEYFFSCTIWDTTRNDEEFDPQLFLDSTGGNNVSITDHPLSCRSLAPETSIVQFLAERVQVHPPFREYLLALIELSKTIPLASQAASNAITILVRAGVLFNGANLRGIRISGADLSGGQFDSAQLQDSDLTGVTMIKSWIRLADFSGASMKGTRFGELPFLREDCWVLSCAFSPDGKSFAAGLEDGDISVYDTDTWIRTMLLQGHTSGITGIAYSSTGHQLLTGSDDKAARLWNCETGLTDFILEGHVRAVTSVAFSPTSKQVASAGRDMTVRFWDARTGSTLFILDDHSNWVTGIAYLARGSKIASSSRDGTIRLFDIRTGRSLLCSKKSKAVYCCISYSPDGQWIVSGDGGGQLQLWEAVSLRPGIKWQGHSGTVTDVNFSPNNHLIVSSGVDNSVKVWDVHTGALISASVGHSDRVASAVFSPDGSQIASTGWDQHVRLWEVSPAGFSFNAEDTTDPQTSVSVSPDGRFLASSGSTGVVRQYDANTGELGLAFSRQEFQVRCIAYSLNGCQIATGGSGGDICLYDTKTGTLQRTLCGHRDYVTTVAYSPCGQWIASGGDDGTVRMWDTLSGSARIWDASSGSERHFLGDERNAVENLVYSPNGLEVVAGYRCEEIRVWRVSNGQCRVVMKSETPWPCFVGYMPGSLQFASCHMSRAKTSKVRLWNKDTNDFRFILKHDVLIQRFAFSSCGLWIATTSGNMVHLWKGVLDEKPRDWRCVSTVEKCFGHVMEIVWRPKALEFAVACEDGSTQMWKVVEKPGRGVLVQLVWGCGGTSIVASGARLVDTKGLRTIHRKLLERRGAITNTLSS